jgi:hypothetical protein
VAFLVNEGDELNCNHQSAVRRVLPYEENPNRLMVEFWSYSPICYLTKDHPEYERAKDTLERTAATDSQGLFANHMHMVAGKTETWWKLLGARLA